MKGGPPVRGTKLLAWRAPLSITNLDERIAAPQGSQVIHMQRQLAAAVRKTLQAVAVDVRDGLAETVGVRATLNDGERSSVMITLPTLPDAYSPQYIAHAIDAENVEAWCDEQGRIHVAVNPWYSTKDIDQTVLSITKVLHVLLGLHATDANSNSHASFWRRLLASAMEVVTLQKRLDRS